MIQKEIHRQRVSGDDDGYSRSMSGIGLTYEVEGQDIRRPPVLWSHSLIVVLESLLSCIPARYRCINVVLDFLSPLTSSSYMLPVHHQSIRIIPLSLSYTSYPHSINKSFSSSSSRQSLSSLSSTRATHTDHSTWANKPWVRGPDTS